MKKTIFLTLVLFLSSCLELPEQDKKHSVDIVIEINEKYDWDHKADAERWTRFTRDAILKHGPSLLSGKAKEGAEKRWCSNFNSLNKEQRIVFWTALVAAMTRYESGFKPSTTYKENFKDQRGKYVVSAGLLQVSQESSKGYGFSDATTEKLKDPEYNLNVGVKILNRWFERDGYIATKVDGKYKGGARYWSVLRPRPNSKVYKIRKVTENISICL